MSKNQKLFSISLLPIVLIVILIAVAGYFLMKGDIKLFKTGNDIEVRRLNGFPTVLDTDQVLEKKRVVIRSNDELNNFLNSIDKSGTLTLKDSVDFNKEIVIGISSKTFPEQGHTLKIRKIYEDKTDKSLLVSSKQLDPPDDCQTEKTQNIIVDLVAINKTDAKVDFELLKDAAKCQES